MRPLVILFAKAPIPGRVKTRLGLDPERAAALHSLFVGRALEMLEGCGEVDCELCTDEPTEAWPEFSGRRTVQASGDLGERMYAALRGGLAGGRRKVMIMGSDSPGLPPSHVQALVASPADVALGPTEDGGFYAIACSRTDPAMFDAVHWSTSSALEDTIQAARGCGLTVELGPSWFDVDRPEDLARLG